MKKKRKKKKKKCLPAQLRKNLTGTVQKNKKSSRQSQLRKHRQRRKACLRELKTRINSSSIFAKHRSTQRRVFCRGLYFISHVQVLELELSDRQNKEKRQCWGKETIWSAPCRHNREGLGFGSSALGSIWHISSELGIFCLPHQCQNPPSPCGVRRKLCGAAKEGTGCSAGGWVGRWSTKISAISSDWCLDNSSAFWMDCGLISHQRHEMSSYSSFKIGKFSNRFQSRSPPKKGEEKKGKTEVLAN